MLVIKESNSVKSVAFVSPNAISEVTPVPNSKKIYSFMKAYPVFKKSVIFLDKSEQAINDGTTAFSSVDYRVYSGTVPGVSNLHGIIPFKLTANNLTDDSLLCPYAVIGKGLFTNCYFVRHIDKCRRTNNSGINFWNHGECVWTPHGDTPSAEWSFTFNTVSCQMKSLNLVDQKHMRSYKGQYVETGHSNSFAAKFQQYRNLISSGGSEEFSFLKDIAAMSLGITSIASVFGSGSTSIESAQHSIVSGFSNTKRDELIYTDTNALSITADKIVPLELVSSTIDAISSNFANVPLIDESFADDTFWNSNGVNLTYIKKSNCVKIDANIRTEHKHMPQINKMPLEFMGIVTFTNYMNTLSGSYFVAYKCINGKFRFAYIVKLTSEVISLGNDKNVMLFTNASTFESKTADSSVTRSLSAKQIKAVLQSRAVGDSIYTVQGELFLDLSKIVATQQQKIETVPTVISTSDVKVHNRVNNDMRYLSLLLPFLSSYFGYRISRTSSKDSNESSKT